MFVAVLIFTALICLSASAGAEEGFTLPASLQVIEEEAFLGTAIENVTFPESLTAVGDRAFADLPGLETVTIPPTEILTVSDTAFEGSSNVMIRGAEGSYAQEWADQNGIPFIPISERPAALVIGQTNYTTYATLPGCRNDAIAVRGMLTGLSHPFSTTLVTDLTAGQMRAAIRSVFSSAKDGDVSLLYYSGHGKKDEETGNHGALVGVDDSLLTFADLAETFSGVKGRVIVILDSCYSGAAIDARGTKRSGNDPLDAFLQDVIASFSSYTQSSDGIGKKSSELAAAKFIVLAAARYYEEAGEDSTGRVLGTQCGVYTYSLLKGLGCAYPAGAYSGSMPADNGDLRVTLKEIFDYSYTEANSIWSVQHAAYYGNDAEVLFRRD